MMFRTASQTSASRAAGTAVSVAVRVVMVVVMLSIFAVAGAGCKATDKQVIAQAEQAHGELQKAVVTEPGMSSYIQNVGDRIVETAGRLNQTEYGKRFDSGKGEDRSWMFSTKTMQFHFVNSKTLNAFTTGGEHMYVYTELLRRCKNENELAAVMAHEYAHVYSRHVQKGMSRQMWAMLGAGAAAGAGYLAGGEEAAGTGAGIGAAIAGLANAGFSRDDENQADHVGFDIYVRDGYDPDQFAGFFRTLMEAEKKAGGAQPEFMSDHPSTPKRVAAAESWATEYKQQHPDWQTRLRPPVADAAQFERIKQRSTQIAQSMPDDKSLDTQKLVSALPRSCLWPDEPHPVSAKQAQQSLQQDLERKQAASGGGGEKPKKRQRDRDER